MGEFVPWVGEQGREGEEAVDVLTRGEGAGADPGEARVQGVVCAHGFQDFSLPLSGGGPASEKTSDAL